MLGVSGAGLAAGAQPPALLGSIVRVTSTQRGKGHSRCSGSQSNDLSLASSLGLSVHQKAVREYQGKYPSSFTLLSEMTAILMY